MNVDPNQTRDQTGPPAIPGSAAPPGPGRGVPLLNYYRFRGDTINFLKKIAREHGDVACFRLGGQNVYFLNNPDHIKDVLVTSNDFFMKGRALQRAKRLLGEGLLTSEGSFHRRQRQLVQPAFHPQRIASYAKIMVDYAERSVTGWRDGQTLDIAQEMMRLTLAIVGKTLFDADVESEAGEIGEALTTIIEMFNLLLLPFSEFLEKFPLPQRRRFDQARARLDATIYRLIEERRKSGFDSGDLLSMLLMAQDEDAGGEGMTDLQVRDEAMTIFLAGHETTSNALTWTWYLLSQNAEVEAKLHAELDEVLHGRLPTMEDVSRLKYTEMVFSESMRLYPPAWAIGRKTIADYHVGGYLIPSGSLVLLSQYVSQRDPRYFPDPEKFDPSRWTQEARDSRPKFSFFPFGGGPRRCIGEGFAWMEGILLIASIARRWRMRLVPGHRVAVRPAMTLRPKYGMRMTVERREMN